MESQATLINDQPIDTTFFSEAQWLTDFVTPNSLEVKELYNDLTVGIQDIRDRILALWERVARMRYEEFVSGKLQIGNLVSYQRDLWQMPSMTIKTRVGNCANKSFLLASLIRNTLSDNEVYVVLGNLNQPGPGGHAWVEVTLDKDYILETTRADMVPFTTAVKASIYEPVIYFNDTSIYAIEGRTVLKPFCRVYADWLKDYLDFVYIQEHREGI